jgi:catechol 2,3-dioxygenase-like lactoylglutathione lyase family enzyme
MPARLAYTTLLIDEYDAALEYFRTVLRFVVLSDEPLADGKRWVGVRFEEAPRDEAYGRVVVFVDRWGNRWDLIQPRA